MPDFTSLGAILFSLAIVAYYLLVYRKKLNRQRLIKAVDALKEALYTDLYLDLLGEGDQDWASRLAATVVNEVFGIEPPDQEARSFRANHKGPVQARVALLAADGEVRSLIGAALRLVEEPGLGPRVGSPGGLKKAFNLGLVNPADEQMPVHRFLGRTAAFHRRVDRRMKSGG
jgi:hypothetical protein